jgi:hypothetical protein
LKATLTFTLPEETDEHRAALEGWRWRSLVQRLDEALRQTAKHGAQKDADRAAWARALLRDAVSEEGLEL